ncbi:hypothetical protein DPMN_041884 [Dreissena polymorpha]|uniref:Uncharacterized protein n=1 Tax=Dreissena polymorpha TaxID=45954 RepID=A0A9D4CZT2_DREPO|nr:hypothetical protein DPMN_041884 [Dreissena polymorpha]
METALRPENVVGRSEEGKICREGRGCKAATKAKPSTPSPASDGFEVVPEPEPLTVGPLKQQKAEPNVYSVVGTRPKKAKRVSTLTPVEKQTMVECLEAHQS